MEKDYSSSYLFLFLNKVGENMSNLEGVMSPTVQLVADTIRKIINDKFNTLPSSAYVMSHIEGKNNDDQWSLTLSFALSNEILNEKVLNFLVIQDIKTRDIATIITTGEKEGMRILYKSITKYPIPSINKYLPNIISSSIDILIKNNI